MTQHHLGNPFELHLDCPGLSYDRELAIKRFGSDVMVHLAVGVLPSIGLEDMVEEHCPEFMSWLESSGRRFHLTSAISIGVTGLSQIESLNGNEDVLVVVSVPNLAAHSSSDVGSNDLKKLTLPQTRYDPK